jgi:hypothetical protein
MSCRLPGGVPKIMRVRASAAPSVPAIITGPKRRNGRLKKDEAITNIAVAVGKIMA